MRQLLRHGQERSPCSSGLAYTTRISDPCWWVPLSPRRIQSLSKSSSSSLPVEKTCPLRTRGHLSLQDLQRECPPLEAASKSAEATDTLSPIDRAHSLGGTSQSRHWTRDRSSQHLGVPRAASVAPPHSLPQEDAQLDQSSFLPRSTPRQDQAYSPAPSSSSITASRPTRTRRRSSSSPGQAAKRYTAHWCRAVSRLGGGGRGRGERREGEGGGREGRQSQSPLRALMWVLAHDILDIRHCHCTFPAGLCRHLS